MASVTQVGALTDFTPNTTIQSAQVDANFAAIRNQFNALINAAGGMYIGDDADANTTLGLTINQGAADDHALTLKSSDVAHAYVSSFETDDFFVVGKRSPTLGGAGLYGLGEDSASLPTTFSISAFGGQADTTKSTAGVGLIEFIAYETDGAGALANITADGNVLSVRARVGGSVVTRFLVDEDGDTWQAGGITAVGSLVAAGITSTAGLVVAGATNIRTSGSVDLIETNDTGIGFFNTSPVAKPTGVTVDAAGIHAALVTLGLIAA